MKHVIIGASAAGIAACEAIRSRDRDSPVTVISDETEGVYSRCLLPHYLSGEWQREALWFREKDFFSRFGITALLGKKAERIDVSTRQVILASGEEVAYDTLLLATGGEAQLPRLPGNEAAGVMALRTLADADKMLAMFGETRRVVILGGGLIGCKAAAALRRTRARPGSSGRNFWTKGSGWRRAPIPGRYWPRGDG
ncbi:MAG: FAD-dependent oxidoreductase [Candidatus Aureabacteria bacterium]|nr:FAD-dependent oxidoreductase [Candidatus Auribacterota bacterium]